MRTVVWLLIGALIVLHQDFWWWTADTLIFGAIPIGLAYHIALSVAASLVWLLAVRYAWPEEPTEFASESDSSSRPLTPASGPTQREH